MTLAEVEKKAKQNAEWRKEAGKRKKKRQRQVKEALNEDHGAREYDEAVGVVCSTALSLVVGVPESEQGHRTLRAMEVLLGGREKLRAFVRAEVGGGPASLVLLVLSLLEEDA